jgi:uncharacterized protein (DUF924 family)
MPWQPLLAWWFGPSSSAAEVAAQRYSLWFGYSPEQDLAAAGLFGSETAAALDGGLQQWNDSAEGWLALVLLLDQLPRMIHRGTPLAFAGDARAQQLVADGLACGRERQLTPLQQVFIYLVLEHHESLGSQDLAVARFQGLLDASTGADRKLFAGFLDYAERHREVIRRFARFPHRNPILGRESTPAELAYLAEPGAGF